MINYKKTLIFSLLISFLISYQAYAFGEIASEIAKDAGEIAEDIGKKVGVGATASEIDKDAELALSQLLKSSPAAEKLDKTAKGILIFPKILKAGLGVGGEHGEGALHENGKTVAYYDIVAGSYGFQIGAQSFGYALFFMDDKGLKHLIDSHEGWQVGVGPSLVMVDKGMAKTITNTTVTESVYVFSFSQKGLMAGAGLQGSKISKIHPEK